MAAPQGATTFIPYSFACAAPSTASRMSPPSRSRISVVAGLRYSEHALSRGNRARSTSSTDAPARASSKAVVAPAGPAPTTTTSQRSVTTSPRSGRRNVRAEHGRGRADERRREIHAVVVEPSPTLRESYQLVADRIAALEPRVARGTLVLALQRRAQEGVREHARHACSREYDKPRSHAPRCQRGGQSGNERRAGHAAQRSQRRDTPRRAAGPQETEEQLFEVELLAARRAVGEVLTDLLLHRGRQLAVEVLIEVLLALPAIHLADPLMYPIPTA